MPFSDTPYFFLSPKIVFDEPIDIPIKLYEKGDEVNFVFWNAPLSKGRMFFIGQLDSPSPSVSLKIKEEKGFNFDFYLSDIFSDGLIKDKNDSPAIEIELYKINHDLTESLVSKKIKTKHDYIANWNDTTIEQKMSDKKMNRQKSHSR
ncbi:hypothetical protein [Pectobacterium sp. B1J-3]|uniref:hypothetical protein n=1 Tax=Pectobacterium sp. B1J-3 TaxID=3385371 RepID=UPI00390608BD